jgi:hypothetical protein
MREIDDITLYRNDILLECSVAPAFGRFSLRLFSVGKFAVESVNYSGFFGFLQDISAVDDQDLPGDVGNIA